MMSIHVFHRLIVFDIIKNTNYISFMFCNGEIFKIHDSKLPKLYYDFIKTKYDNSLITKINQEILENYICSI